MEDVLDLYAMPVNPKRPLVCMDEFCKQLLSEVSEPLPAKPAKDEGKKGQRRRQDSEYVREGSASAFMICAPHLGKREVFVAEKATRTAIDYAHAVRFLCEEMFPEAEKIILVQDNLNTHNIASLYKAFPPEEARQLAQRLELHFTPKHGSWLNMAEIEISVLSRCALKGRVGDVQTFREAIAKDSMRRNQSARPINWQFTTTDARQKLRRLYPSI
jgi:hypothetical protein